jgi:replicative DNA helicase
VIGCALLNPETIDASGLSPEDFSTAWGSSTWRALMRLALHGDPVTETTVHEESGAKISELTAATDEAILPAQIPWFSREIRTAAFRRRLIAVMTEGRARLERANGVDAIPEVVALLVDALDDTPAAQQPRRLTAFVDELVADLPARREKGQPGLPSGFPTLDSRTGGLRPGSLFVIAAGTGVGKSLLAANIALAARVPTILFSLEMTGLEVAERIIAAASGVAATQIQRGNVSNAEILVLERAAEAHQRIWIDERPAPSVAEIAATARSLHRRENAGLVIVDYLQIVRPQQDERREAEVAAVARGLRALGRQLNVPVIALAQLNRDGMVRDSAVIEHEAHVLAVFERKKGSESATLELRKNRHGPHDSIALRFDKKTLRLREVQQA